MSLDFVDRVALTGKKYVLHDRRGSAGLACLGRWTDRGRAYFFDGFIPAAKPKRPGARGTS